MTDPVEAFRAAAIARLKKASESALALSNDKKARAYERKAHAYAYYAFLSAVVMVEALSTPEVGGLAVDLKASA